MKRKRILADYASDIDENGKTFYRYEGPLYSLSGERAVRGKYIAACWISPIVTLLILFAMGRLNSEGSRVFYVALPYVGIYAPALLLLGDAYKVTTAKKAMRRAEYERSVLQMRRATLSGVALSALMLVGQTLLLFRVQNDTEVTFLALTGLLCAILVAFARLQRYFIEILLQVDQNR